MHEAIIAHPMPFVVHYSLHLIHRLDVFPILKAFDHLFVGRRSFERHLLRAY